MKGAPLYLLYDPCPWSSCTCTDRVNDAVAFVSSTVAGCPAVRTRAVCNANPLSANSLRFKPNADNPQE